MNAIAVDTDLLRTAVERLSARNLSTVREAALANFCRAGLPTTRHEAWRYTNLTPVAELSNRWLTDWPRPSSSPLSDEDQGTAVRDQVDAFWIVIRDGRIDPRSLADLEQHFGSGVTVGRLSDGSDASSVHIDDALSSLNAALMDDAVTLHIADNVAVDKPIGILLADEATPSTSVCQLRFLIHIGQGASADFVEAHHSRGETDHLTNLVTQIDLAPGASARHVKIQERSEQHLQIGRLLVKLARDSRFEHASVDLGGKLIRNDVVAMIAGPGAHVSSSGIYLAHGTQHIDNHIHAEHAVGPATSRQAYRGIASGRSRCVFNGKAVVREGADGTDAEQSNHNLLLSDRAEIDTKPELEIYADDVKCNHGATVGQLDKRALFYLRSRGLDRAQAAQVLTRAFAGRIIADIPIDSVRQYVERIVDHKLDRLVEDDAP